MHEHEDKKCEHNLKHCAHCDVVFCEKCQREWKTTSYDSAWLQQFRQHQEPQPKQNNPWAKPGPDVILCSHPIRPVRQ